MKKEASRRGVAFPLIVLGMLVVIPLLVVLFQMNREFTGQVAHVDEVIRCRAIAMSVFLTVQARIRETPYSKRFFTPKPFSEFMGDFQGGDYELFVSDTPGKPMQADIYVSVTFRRVTRLFFWRVRIETTVLDAVGRLMPILFTSLDPSRFGNGSPNSTADSYVNQILADRKNNRKIAAEKVAQIKPLGNLDPILDILQVPEKSPAANDADPAAATIGPVPPLPEPPKVPISSVIFKEDFEGLSDGQYPPGWTYVNNYGTGNVSSEKAAGGQRSMKFNSDATTTIQSKIPIDVGSPPPDHLIIEMDVCVQNPGTSCCAFGWMPVTNNSIFFRGDDQSISFVEAPEQFRSIRPFVAGKWYHLKIDFNSIDRKTDVSIDGQPAGPGLPYSSSAPDHFMIGTAHNKIGNGNQTSYFDNIEIRGE